MQPPVNEIDLLPAQGAQLRGAQAMAEGQQDHGGVAVAVAVIASVLASRALVRRLRLPSAGRGVLNNACRDWVFKAITERGPVFHAQCARLAARYGQGA